MIPHPIRLRHPWDQLPSRTPGRTIYRRLFKCPTGLDTWEHVFLEVDRIVFSGEISLNGQPIGRLESGQFFSVDITPFLQPSNELQMEVVDPQTAVTAPDQVDAPRQSPPSHSVYITNPNEPPGSPIGDVRLLIRSLHPSNQ